MTFSNPSVFQLPPPIYIRCILNLAIQYIRVWEPMKLGKVNQTHVYKKQKSFVLCFVVKCSYCVTEVYFVDKYSTCNKQDCNNVSGDVHTSGSLYQVFSITARSENCSLSTSRIRTMPASQLVDTKHCTVKVV